MKQHFVPIHEYDSGAMGRAIGANQRVEESMGAIGDRNGCRNLNWFTDRLSERGADDSWG
jgi:hypothetical protein